MPTALLPDIHPTQLRDRLAQDIASALAEGVLDPPQHLRLQSLCSEHPEPTLRLSRVTLAGYPGELSDALIIDDSLSATPLLYLHTALHGIERFTDRHALNTLLLKRAGVAGPAAVLEQERLNGHVFEQQMRTLLTARVQGLHELAEHLQALPSLSDVLLNLFEQKLGLLESATVSQPAQLLLQHVEGSTVRRTLSLPQQLLEHYHQTPLPPGQVRRWLAPQGSPLREQSAQVFERALVSPSDDLREAVERTLRAYWGQGQHREALARVLARNYEHTLLRQRNDASLAQEQVQWLQRVLSQGLALETLTLSDGNQPDLALDAFRVVRRHRTATSGYLYSAAQGFEPFADLQALNQRFQALNDAARLPAGLTAQEQVTFLSMDRLLVNLSPPAQPGFAQWADDLIQWQSRNAQQALPGFNPRALDIGPLVDLRLPAYQADTPMADLEAQPDKAWLTRLTALSERQLAWQQRQPTLQGCALTLLDPYLAVLTWPCLKANTLLVQMTLPEGTAAPTRTLAALLLERVSGATVFAASAQGAQLIVADGQRAPAPSLQFDALLLDNLLDLTAPLLRGHYQEACDAPCPGLYEVFEQALRIESAGLRESLDETASILDDFDQVLNLPSDPMRSRMGTLKAQVHNLALSFDDCPPFPLEGTFVIHRVTAPQGPLLLWSPATGLQYLPSLTTLFTRLLADLYNPRHRESILALIAEAQRTPLRQRLAQVTPATVQVHTRALNYNLIQALLDSRQRWVNSATECAWALAVKGRFEAPLFNDLLVHSLLAPPVQPDLPRLISSLQNAELQKALPQWARDVTPDQLQTYANLLYECLEAQKPENAYLNGVPDIKQFALGKLREAMVANHGPFNLDLDQVRVTFKTYDALPPLTGNTPSGAPAVTHSTTLTLADSALRQFSGRQSAVASVSLAGGSTPPAWLTAQYLSELVAQLDIGQQYREMLEQHFQPTNPQYRQREKKYGSTLSAQLRELGYRMLMQKNLSPLAYDYLDCVLRMPDALARQAVSGQDIVLRQVRLIAEPGMKPDAVTGMYLIGPRNTALGPVLLLTPYNQAYGLREFKNQGEFLDLTRTSDRLASLIVWRLDDTARPRYDHGGLQEPHLPWSVESDFDVPVYIPARPTLDDDTVVGNALSFLFEDNLHLLQMMARRQTVTRAEADWQAFITLATLGLEQGSLFLPGELVIMVNAWQGQLLLKSSVHSAVQKRWGQALAEFCAALSNLAGHRRAVAAERAVRPTLLLPKRSDSAPLAQATDTPALDFGWHQQHVPAQLKARLVPFEQQGLALNDLLKDPLTYLYSANGAAPYYAAITGKVYQVGLYEGHWCIVRDQQRGPRIRLNSAQNWELDLQWGLRGGGACLGKHESDLAELQNHIDDLLDIQASGMLEVHQRFSVQGQQFTTAHHKALEYVRTSLENLNSTQADLPLSAPVLKILDDFLKIGPLTPPVLMKLRTRFRQIFGALLETSLAPATSPRIILGRSKHPKLRLIAFTMKDDPLQRIYLTERYFSVPNWMFQHTQLTVSDFEVTAHYQASTLIHELSHQVLDTQDIAYVESAAPFLDLMEDTTPLGKRLRADTERLQQRKLSMDAPTTELFTMQDDGLLNDVTGRAYARILDITGRVTLVEARSDFYADPVKRLEIILNNADSLTLLITLLGRKRY